MKILKLKWSNINRLLTIENCLYLLCGLFCLYQIHFMITKYLKFDFITRINLYVPDQTPLPDLVLCFRFIDLINVTKFKTNYPLLAQNLNITNETDYRQLIQSSPVKLINIFIENLTVKQVTNLLYSKESIIERIQILDQNSDSNPDLCHIKSFYLSLSYCLLTACSYKKVVYTNIFMYDHHSESKSFFQMSLNNKYFDSNQPFQLTLVKQNSLPWSRDLRWLDLDSVGGPYIFTISFTMFVQKLLPSPYPSNCHDYLDEGFSNQPEAFNDCLNTNSLKQLSVPFHSTVIPDDLDNYFFQKIILNTSNSNRKKVFLQVIDTCLELTKRVDCSVTSFPIQDYDKYYNDFGSTLIVMEQIKEPIFIVLNEPSMTFSDCCISIGSILGAWFGFSMSYHVPIIVSRLCQNFKDHFKARKYHGQRIESNQINHQLKLYFIDSSRLNRTRFQH